MALTQKEQKMIASDPDAHELAQRYECAITTYGLRAWGDGNEIPRTTKGYMPKAERVIGCTCEMFWSRRPANHQTDNRHLKIKFKVHFEVLRGIAWLIQRGRSSQTPWQMPPIEVLVNVAMDLHMAANLGVWVSAWKENPDGTKGADVLYRIYGHRMEEYAREYNERTGDTVTDTLSIRSITVD